MSRALLEVSGLSMRFGGFLQPVNGVALSVQPKQVVSPMLRPQPELKP